MSLLTNMKELSIGGISLKELYIAGIQAWKKLVYTNQIPISTDTDGSIYNKTGYKEGYRIRSVGAEVAAAYLTCTGFIPCKSGDIIRFGYLDGKKIWTDNTSFATYLNFSDSNKANIGQFTSQPATYGIFEGTSEYEKPVKNNGFWEYEVLDGYDIAFVRITFPYNDGYDASKIIVTVNEEIV